MRSSFKTALRRFSSRLLDLFDDAGYRPAPNGSSEGAVVSMPVLERPIISRQAPPTEHDQQSRSRAPDAQPSPWEPVLRFASATAGAGVAGGVVAGPIGAAIGGILGATLAGSVNARQRRAGSRSVGLR